MFYSIKIVLFSGTLLINKRYFFILGILYILIIILRYYFIKFILFICVLVNVALITYLERKILGYVQMRKGPRKVGFVGLFQPFRDAVKLFLKEKSKLYLINTWYYYAFPLLSLILILFYWSIIVYDFHFVGLTLNYEIVYIIVISRIIVYVIIIRGWSSNSKYSLIGRFRGVAQVISYEVRFSFLIFNLCIFSGELTFRTLLDIQYGYKIFIFGIFIIFFFWIFIILAETRRSPFDLPERESELVSGFNTEYGGFLFALLFISEYGRILFIRLFSSYIFFSGSLIFIIIVVLLILIIRATYVRIRYDNLIIISWKQILPCVMLTLIIGITYLMI